MARKAKIIFIPNLMKHFTKLLSGHIIRNVNYTINF